MHCSVLASLCIACALATALAAEGQEPGQISGQTPAETQALQRADSLYFAGSPARALALCDSVLARDSLKVEFLWRGARAATVLGFLAPQQRADDRNYLRAEALARRLIATAPRRADGHYWLAAALGRRGLAAENIAQARLAEATYTAALQTLAIDSAHAGAHNILGRMHAQIRTLSRYQRWIAATALGVRAAKHSHWDSAAVHLRRAVVLDTAIILFRLDLGEMLLHAGRRAEAEVVLRSVATMRRIHPPDLQLQEKARVLLGGLPPASRAER